MPAYSIYCSGRRYPNAPERTKGGCLERPPPYYFFPFTGGFTGLWADINAVFVPCRFAGVSPTSGWDVRSNWNADPSLGTGRNVNVNTQKVAGVWRIQVEYQYSNFAGLQQAFYRRDFPSGFPKWPDFYQVDFSHVAPSWTFGTPAFLNLWIGNYGLCPIDLCLP